MIREYKWRGQSLRMNPHEWRTADCVLSHDEYNIEVLLQAEHEIRTVVDVGANIGAFSVMAATFWPDANIIAIEPHPDTFELLQQNVAQFPNVIPIHAAITEQRGTAIITDDQLSVSNKISEIWHGLACARPYVGIEVPAMAIVDAIVDHKLKSIDLLKTDCEGAEYVLFEQLWRAEWLKNVGWIRGEWHHKPSNYRLQAALAATHELSIDNNEPHEVGLFIAHRK